ncbi:MAG: hypothetical protein ABW046_20605 [Actinoplanes sp.]
MTEKNTYWLRNPINGYSALVTGAAERDRWLAQGYAEADEPAAGFVHVWHEGIELPGILPIAALNDVYSQLGWVAGPPPGGERPADAPFGESAEPAAKANAAPAKSTSKTAAGGEEKE